MSFADWVKESNNKYTYVSFKPKVISPNSGKIKLIKHEQEIFKISEEDMVIKKHL